MIELLEISWLSDLHREYLPLEGKSYREKDVVYKDAIPRAERTEKFFREELKVEEVEVLKDLTK